VRDRWKSWRPEIPGGRGKTTISDEVVSVIARIAAEEVDGVHQIGASSLRGVFSRGRHVGVEAEVGLKEAAVDIDLIVIYGYPIPTIAETMRQQIIEQVEFMTGRRVVEVNVNVVDVHVPRVEAAKSSRRQLE
jgi:uncharacterized alkaline shock family protein YloU